MNVETLKTLVSYDPETGVMTRKVDGGRAASAGSVVGFRSGHKSQYLSARIGGRRELLHRWIWFYMTGAWPDGVIDHIDRDPLNNRWSNLRLTTQAMNRRNNSRPRHNTSGVLGVVKHRDRWRAQIFADNRTVHLGVYATIEEAAAVRAKAARELWGEFAPKESVSS